MGLASTYTCDCCGLVLPSLGVLDAITVMSITAATSTEPSVVVQHWYGWVCGCAPDMLAAIQAEKANHAANHTPVV